MEKKQVFIDPVYEIEDMRRLKGLLSEGGPGAYSLSGLLSAARVLFFYALGSGCAKKLIVLSSEQEAQSLYDEYRFYDRNCRYYPAKDLLFYGASIRSNELTAERVRVLKDVLEKDEITVFTTIEALLGKLPPVDAFRKKGLEIGIGDTVDIEETKASLIAMGYEFAAIVSGPGQFCVRGGIIDVFPLTEVLPYRIELWGDEVDSVRRFDADTQKSVDTVDIASIFPATELALDESTLDTGMKNMTDDYKSIYADLMLQAKTEEAFSLKSIFEDRVFGDIRTDKLFLEAYLTYFYEKTSVLTDFFGDDSCIFAEDVKKLYEVAEASYKEFVDGMKSRLGVGLSLPRQMSLMESPKALFEKFKEHRLLYLSGLSDSGSPLPAGESFHISTRPSMTFNNSVALLKKEINEYLKKKFKVIICGTSRTRQKRLCEGLNLDGISCYFSENYSEKISYGTVLITVAGLSGSVEFTDARTVYLSENDIFGGNYRRRKKKTYKKGDAIESFRQLTVGDYVVHENYGLGIYKGIEKIEQDRIIKDFIKIGYANNDHLYVPVSQLEIISKYSGAEDAKPRLSSLTSKEWKRTKDGVKSAVGEMAKDLVKLYALRQQERGYAFGPDTNWQQEFEEMFPYEETRGQLEAIEEVKKDLMSKKIMDRLVCGDVGFGKTEIALRAAFKVVQENKQVIFLVPTTVLAQQHYNTFTARMKDYPVNVGLLSRFRTKGQNDETVRMLKSGELDIVIGTHRALSSDVEFKDLGLLVIDEEQRFGVKHKEKIKKLKNNVDVLSLTATPIPRTLHMSLIGIRDMSLLDEAPLERQPVQTFVFEENEEMVREAIERELSRGGQVYYVVNRIRQIPDIAARIQKLVPDANVVYAHGRMTENSLEDIMADFVDKQIDVLVATTIIEIGLDISNVNTIIIHDADNFGLSQLYQLRGRVGRSSRTAYAFLMYRKDKMIKEVAEKRLTAIKEFSDLGSGFKIAMRDLEIRGAGNLLGAEQHGHMAAVGYDLYCKLLSTALKIEKGEDVLPDFETLIDIKADAYIPADYIPDEAQKLEIYRRISLVCDDESQEIITDELIDRFGDPPKSIISLIKIARLKAVAHNAFVTRILQKGDTVRLDLLADGRINPANIPEFVEGHEGALRFEADVKAPAFVWRIPGYKSGSDIVPELTGFCEGMIKALCLAQ